MSTGNLRFTFGRLSFLIFILIVIPIPDTALSKDIHKWVGEDGNVYYSNTESGVPEKYNNVDNTLKFENKINVMGEDSPYDANNNYYTGDEEQPSATGVYRIKFNAYEGSTRRIIIPVKFNNSITAPLALDTGSPGLIITTGLAKKLGLYESDSGLLLSFAKGIGGQTTVIRTIIDEINIGGATESFIPAIITNSMSDSFEGLIGMDFMSKYSISIDNRNHYLLLKANTDSSGLPAGHGQGWWRSAFQEFREYQEGWQKVSGLIDEWEHKSLINTDIGNNDVKKLKQLAQWQYLESTKLLNRLDSYARQHDVPQDWRR